MTINTMRADVPKPGTLENKLDFSPHIDGSDLLKQGHDTGLFGVNHPTNHKGSRSQFMNSIMNNFEIIDTDKDDALSKRELDDFIEKADTTPQDKVVAQVLRDHFDKIENFDDKFHDMIDYEDMMSEKLFYDNKITNADLKVLSLALDPKEFNRTLKGVGISNNIRAFGGALIGFALSGPLVVGGSAVAMATTGPVAIAGLAVAGAAVAYPLVRLAVPLAYDAAASVNYVMTAREVNKWNYFEAPSTLRRER